MQTISSANTSLNQISAALWHVLSDSISGEKVLDYGAGRYELGKELAEKRGVELLRYDPYHLPEEENRSTLARAKEASVVVCANVLNVLTDEALEETLAHLASLGPFVLIGIYEGDRSGVGKVTKKDCYQRNEKKTAYLPILKRYFSYVTMRKGFIYCFARSGE